MKRFLGPLIGLAALLTAFGSLDYVLGDPQTFSMPFRPKYQSHLELVRTHGIAAALTLILGPLQFVSKLPYHRQRGRLYLLGVLVGTITALPMSAMAEGGLWSEIGFLLMSLLWGFTGLKAYLTIRRGQVAEHRVWVVRNFALSMGAVTLRGYLHFAQGLGWDFYALYPSAVWVCWIPCLLAAEWWIGPAVFVSGLDRQKVRQRI